MYIWMVLATFLAILYSFTLPYRADIRDVTIVPKAEAIVGALVIKHRAAIDYMYDMSENGVTYVEGEIADDDLKPYVKYGFALDKIYYSSQIYCIKADSVVSGYNIPAVNCFDPNTVKYLVTYGCVPERWLTVTSKSPNRDIQRAMQNIVEYGNNFGIAVEAQEANDLGSSMSIIGREGVVVAVPEYIANKVVVIEDAETGEEISDGNSFKDVCGENGSCDNCLVYITPFG